MTEYKRFHVRAAESGDYIDSYDSLIDAAIFYRECENEDKAEGVFTPGFYEIYDSEKEEIVVGGRNYGPLDSLSFTKTIRKSGNSLMINITGEAALIGADRGSLINVTISKAWDL